MPHLRGRPVPQHFMSVDGGDYAAGARAIGAGLRMADDALIVSPHGTTTHMDALCHMWAGEELYTIAASSATWMGLCNGSTTMPLPSRSRSVRAARWDRRLKIDGTTPYSLKWCSATQTPSKPSSSSNSMISI